MDDAIRAMIEKRRPRDEADWERALREVLQEAALAGLWRRGFFDQAAFYGGTALRLYGSGGGQARGHENCEEKILHRWPLAKRFGLDNISVFDLWQVSKLYGEPHPA